MSVGYKFQPGGTEAVAAEFRRLQKEIDDLRRIVGGVVGGVPGIPGPAGADGASAVPSFDRITLQWFTDDIESDAPGYIPAWPGGMGGAFDSFGSSVLLNPGGDDGRVYLFGEGVYAATLSIQTQHSTADPTQIVSAALQWFDAPDGEDVAVILPGGVPNRGDTNNPGVSRTAYSEGRGVAGGGLKVYVDAVDGPGTGLNTALGHVWVTLLVQRIT
jgi:hypothetical protein